MIPLLDNEQLFQQKERKEGYVQIQQPTMTLEADEFDSMRNYYIRTHEGNDCLWSDR